MMWLRSVLARAYKANTPKPDQSSQLQQAADRERFLTAKLAELAERDAMREAERSFQSMADELVEARSMAGAGPWRIGPAAAAATDKLVKTLREAFRSKESAAGAIGAYGDIELALMTVDWRREINFSVLQFSRWGIQQIILICRLYYIKNPIVRRLIDVCAAYVFARGVDITTSDEAANEVIKEFLEDNRCVFGQVALVQAERAKDTDGNLFWCLFPDPLQSGKTKARMIDATEICEIHANPDDSDEPWYYLRSWTQENFDVNSGRTSNVVMNAWYPAMGFEPDERPVEIRSYPVMWNACIHHRKCGFVGKWTMGCPRAFPMMDWAKEARRYLEACASVAQSLMQIGLMVTTKGGQQAIAGVKNQMSTTVGPTNNIWDSNPPAVSGAMTAMGTGTKIEAFKTQGAGCDPEGVRQYKLMCCMTAGVPETFLADVSTGNLATATSLDRPTETIFLEKQESWREDLVVIMQFVLKTSAGATSGKLAEARRGAKFQIVECRRKRLADGSLVYEAFKTSTDTSDVEIQVNFPAIREGDMPANVGALVKAMTLDNKAGQVIGIDEKVGVIALYDTLGIENGKEHAEAQYPEATYEPDRSKRPIPVPIAKPKSFPGGLQPTPAQAPDIPGQPTPGTTDSGVAEALKRVGAAIALMEPSHNGHS